MTTAGIPLDVLTAIIAQQQFDLEALRREYEARQARLANLKNRKKELKAQLHQIDAAIQAVD